MRLRLPHVLSMMTLILAAGVISVKQFEAGRGGSTVPGLVVIDAPFCDVAAAERLLQTRPDARLSWTAADAGPLAPFGADFVSRRTAHGARAVLVAPPPGAQPPPREPFGTLLQAGTDGRTAARTLANFLVEGAGTVPFVAALPLDASSRPVLDEIVGTLELAIAHLPSFRRTSLVVLGLREPDSGRRLALRIDRGRWPRPPRPALADLIEDSW